MFARQVPPRWTGESCVCRPVVEARRFALPFFARGCVIKCNYFRRSNFSGTLCVVDLRAAARRRGVGRRDSVLCRAALEREEGRGCMVRREARPQKEDLFRTLLKSQPVMAEVPRGITSGKRSFGQRFLFYHFSDNRTKSSRTAPLRQMRGCKFLYNDDGSD